MWFKCAYQVCFPLQVGTQVIWAGRNPSFHHARSYQLLSKYSDSRFRSVSFWQQVHIYRRGIWRRWLSKGVTVMSDFRTDWFGFVRLCRWADWDRVVGLATRRTAPKVMEWNEEPAEWWKLLAFAYRTRSQCWTFSLLMGLSRHRWRTSPKGIYVKARAFLKQAQFWETFRMQRFLPFNKRFLNAMEYASIIQWPHICMFKRRFPTEITIEVAH